MKMTRNIALAYFIFALGAAVGITGTIFYYESGSTYLSKKNKKIEDTHKFLEKLSKEGDKSEINKILKGK